MQNELAKSLARFVRESADRLAGLEATSLDTAAGPQGWTPRQTIGHLIDLATRHQYALIAAAAPGHTGELSVPACDPQHWVEHQGYEHGDWNQLLVYWLAVNYQMAQTLAHTTDAHFAVPVRIGDDPPVGLKFLHDTYVDDLKQHLAQLDAEVDLPADPDTDG